jgi:ribonuclease HI
MPSVINVVKVYTDGACPGNTGPGAIGVVVLDENNQELAACKECIGQTTNNRAEYRALIRGLELAAGVCRRKLICFSDSELMVNQLDGVYKIKKPELLKLYLDVKSREQIFDEVLYQYTPRTNRYLGKADKLAREALART